MLAASSFLREGVPSLSTMSPIDYSDMFVFTSGDRMDVSPVRWNSSPQLSPRSHRSGSLHQQPVSPEERRQQPDMDLVPKPLRVDSSGRQRLQPYTEPILQTEWGDDSPSSYRLSRWYDHVQPYFQGLDTPRPIELVSPLLPSPIDTQTAQAAEESKRRRRGRRGCDLLAWDDEAEARQSEPTDFSLIYPQMNPYSGDRLSVISAPDELEHFQARLTSHCDTAGYIVLESPDDPPPLRIQRSPTYPPANRRRNHNSTTMGETAFEAEEDFHLFAQATAGLSPVQTFSHAQPHPRLTLSLQTNCTSVPAIRVDNEAPVSPFAETPTTRHALAQLAQMPEGSTQSLYDTRPSPVDPPPMIVRATTVIPQISRIDEFEAGGGYDDLPNYAESQAQAQASRRQEAARRAQELQRRWVLTGARRGL